MSLLPTKKTLTTLAMDTLLLMLSVSAFGGALYYISGIEREIAAKEKELQSEQTFSASLQDIKTSLRNSAGEIELFRRYFIEDQATIQYLDKIESYAKSNNVLLQLSLSPSITPLENEVAKLGTYNISLDVEGSFNNIMRFYEALAIDNTMVQISDLTISRKPLESRGSVDEVNAIQLSSAWQSAAKITVYQIIN